MTSRRSSTDSGRGAAADRRISRCAAVLLSARGGGRQGVAGGSVEPSSRFLARTFRSGLSAGIRLRTAARVQAGAGSVVENAPKTLSSCRTLPLDEGLVAVLKRSVRYAQDRLALGAAHADSSYVAVNEGGVHARHAHEDVAQTGRVSRCATDPAARHPALLRDRAAPMRRAAGRHREVARPRRRGDHGAHLRKLSEIASDGRIFAGCLLSGRRQCSYAIGSTVGLTCVT